MRAHQPAREQLVERRQRVRLAQVGGGEREVEVDRIAGHRGALREPPAVLAERRDLLLQRAGDRARDARPGRLGGDAAARRVLARELLQEERVAAAGLVDRAAHGAGDLGAEQRLGVGERQRAERVLDHRAVALGGGQRGREQRADGSGAEGEGEQDAAARRPAQQRGDQLQRRVVGPVQVVEHEHQRLLRRDPFQQHAHRAVGAVALVLQARRDPPDGRDHRGQLGQLVADEALQAIDPEERGVVGQRVLPDAERQLALELGRAAGEHQRARLRGAGHQLVEQARLADPALAARRRSRCPGVDRGARSASSTAASSARRPRSRSMVTTRQSNRRGIRSGG